MDHTDFSLEYQCRIRSTETRMEESVHLCRKEARHVWRAFCTSKLRPSRPLRVRLDLATLQKSGRVESSHAGLFEMQDFGVCYASVPARMREEAAESILYTARPNKMLFTAMQPTSLHYRQCTRRYALISHRSQVYSMAPWFSMTCQFATVRHPNFSTASRVFADHIPPQ